MRKLLFVLGSGMMIAMAGCLKNDAPVYDCSPVTTTASASEVAALKKYIDSNNIMATQDSRGFFYKIDSSASTTSSHPTKCSYVSVAYVGKLTNGTTFDSTSELKPASFSLSSLIIGWQEAIPFMKTNSTMQLYLPPSLGYGTTSVGPIPANSNLVFTIKLLGFAN